VVQALGNAGQFGRLKVAEDKVVLFAFRVVTRLFIPEVQPLLASPPAAQAGEFLAYSATDRVADSREDALPISTP